jgi:replicative DNA helicase
MLVSSMVANATTIINAAEYGRTIYDLATRRSLIVIGEDLVNTAYDSAVDHPPKAQIEDAESRLYTLAEANKYGQGFESFQSALTHAISMANAAFQRSGHLSGASTGLSDLDNKLGGLQRSDLIILAGRPSMGKTALATNIAYNVAKAYKGERAADGSMATVDGGIVGFFSLEMSSEQLATRILAEQAEISSEKIRRGMIDEQEFRKLSEVAAEMSRIPLFIDQRRHHVCAIVPRAVEASTASTCSFDYLQLLAGSKRRRQPRSNRRNHHGPKALAKELVVPIIALSQLASGREPRTSARALGLA